MKMMFDQDVMGYIMNENRCSQGDGEWTLDLHSKFIQMRVAFLLKLQPHRMLMFSSFNNMI